MSRVAEKVWRHRFLAPAAIWIKALQPSSEGRGGTHQAVNDRVEQGTKAKGRQQVRVKAGAQIAKHVRR
jgi:hypothetical protein